MACREDRLKEWAKTLSPDTMRELLVELTDFAIDSEYVCFWDDTKIPYWDGNGENIDGSEREHEKD
jgi:hypothetical protein